MASKLYGVNSIIIIFVFVLYCIVINNIDDQSCGPNITLNTAAITKSNNLKLYKNPFFLLYMKKTKLGLLLVRINYLTI